MRAKFGRDLMACSKKVTLKFIIGCCQFEDSMIAHCQCRHQDI